MSGDIQGQFNIGNALTQMGQNQQNALTTYADLRARNMANQQTASQMAAQADWQKAYDPTTGQYSPQKYNALVAADPAARYAAQDATQAGQANLASQLANQGAQIKNAYSKVSYLADMATGYAENQPSAKQMQSDFADGINQGLIDPTEGAQILSMVPSDPTQAAAWWKNEAQHLSANAGQIGRFLPQPETVNTGGGTQFVNASPLSNPGITNTYIPSTLSPSQAAAPVTVQSTAGSTTEPLGQYAAQNGQGGGGMGTGYAPPAQPGQAAQAVPAVPVANGSTAPVQAPAPAPAPVSSAPTSSAPNWNGIAYPSWAQQGNGMIPAGLPDLQAQSTSEYTATRGAIEKAANQFNLLDSITAEGTAGNPGTLAPLEANFGSALQQLGLITGDQATNLQLTGKSVSQYIQQAGNSLGVPTDSKMSEISAGTPNSTMTPKAIAAASAQLKGMIQYKQAEMQAFNNYTQNAPQGYAVGAGAWADFDTKFQQQVPVAVFQLPNMPSDIRSQYLKSLMKNSPDEAYQIYKAERQTLPAMGLNNGG